jgi:hypothetical protein
MYKHYIKINEKNEVIDAFCSAFREPDEDSILVAETDERHFNPTLQAPEGIYRYIFENGKIVERSIEEIESMAKPIRDRRMILVRLEELDKIIPRCVEDLCKATRIEPYKTVQDAMNEKDALREELRSKFNG